MCYVAKTKREANLESVDYIACVVFMLYYRPRDGVVEVSVSVRSPGLATLPAGVVSRALLRSKI